MSTWAPHPSHSEPGRGFDCDMCEAASCAALEKPCQTTRAFLGWEIARDDSRSLERLWCAKKDGMELFSKNRWFLQTVIEESA